ncbi:MAG: chemotaxis protein CheA [Candidatus Hydrogenedentota bacterium]
MAEQEQLKTLEDLCERMALIDAKDLPGLAQVYAAFESFAAWAAENTAMPELPAVANAAAELVNNVILEEGGPAEPQLARVGEMLDYLQRALRNGAAPPVPPEWGISAGAPAEPAAAEDATSPALSEAEPVEEAPPSEASPPSYGGEIITEDFDLLNEFFDEAKEHLAQADLHLLTLETEPDNRDAIDAVFRAFHTIKGAAGLLQMLTVQTLAHLSESLLDKVRQGTLRMEDEAVDLSFESVDGLKRLMKEHEEALRAGVATPSAEWVGELATRLEAVVENKERPLRLGEILIESGAALREDVEAALGEQAKSDQPRKLGEMLVSSGKVEAREAAEALRKQEEQRRSMFHSREAIKVDADRLDHLVDLIGELVIAGAMVRQAPEVNDDPMSELGRRLTLMEKITRELQEISMSLRMVTLRGAFQRMARLARDLAKKQGKNVAFVSEGDDTELDKNVVDQMADPLMHMVRNAVDHGIEPPAERAANGKPEQATLTLRAFHERGAVAVEIEEDGRGLDREAIVAKAIERELISDGENLSDSEVWNLVFQPGFSTAKEVTDVSGRGVGMDVVQRKIAALRGQTEIRSTPGQGTVFAIRLPLTLAIIDGMGLVAGKERYIVPIGNIIRAVRPEPGDLYTVAQRGEMLKQQGSLIPLFRLSRLLNIGEAVQDPTEAIALLVEDGGKQLAILADTLLGQQQTVIKPLGQGIPPVAGVAGGAIMPDGRVGLILDVAGLIRRTHETTVETAARAGAGEQGSLATAHAEAGE